MMVIRTALNLSRRITHAVPLLNTSWHSVNCHSAACTAAHLSLRAAQWEQAWLADVAAWRGSGRGHRNAWQEVCGRQGRGSEQGWALSPTQTSA